MENESLNAKSENVVSKVVSKIVSKVVSKVVSNELQNYLNERYQKDSVQYKTMKLLIWQAQHTSIVLGYLQCLSFASNKIDEVCNTHLKQDVQAMSMAVSPSFDTMSSIAFCDEKLSNLIQTTEDLQYTYQYFACVGIKAQTEKFSSLQEKYLQTLLSIKS